jgi:ketopantoate reductase
LQQEQPDFQTNCGIATLKDCHVILVCVIATDTERTVALLKTTLPAHTKAEGPPIGIFSFQHGCSNFDKIEAGLKGSANLLLVDGAVGFHVVRGRVDGVIRPLVPGQLVLERLSKEKSDHGVNFVNLLSTTELPMLFRKKLTPYTWGTMVQDCCLATNALTGGSLDSHLRARTNRLVYAQMIRECLQVFRVAANYDKWAPSNAASCSIELPMLEQLLCLPDLLFAPVKYFAFPCAPDAGSPAQDDLQARRNTTALWTMQQLVGVGTKYTVRMALV